MNSETQNTKPSTKKVKPSTDSLRVKRETKKKVLAELTAINRKEFGRKVTTDEYIALAVSLLKPEHLEKLREQSLTNKDRLEKRYQEYCVAHGKVSKDEYIGVLLLTGQVGNS